ncbi:HAMP domain-containing histidine kinase [Aetokthonos hydrillicola Thurmond2011]|jgi:OmpR-family two-component system manganese-sensing sensor histidine kinase|uniref:histidine kinase n=1 Tax=Aetokthonos hydrillicola Thurmond2011 TaxID=2712845 RepID=A0AAP5M444_9CYAN|nr:HAMP domain-containing sensor histidine kinase [Aetokthonos hydrillicola]MBO3462144.1 sensor histidine kinase [Aetokthonos hydrillicola CCALA 1050]MBW4587853.1 HAMP domain-containing histidine kinase [Aetokthonos hydrillicola CCALA 1050]MDR9894501.1 HAMP domain-containing histidine kinase [Aetokthonos hydrillicola Thurmond2011]
MFQATRRRLALWYTAVTALLLLLFASGVYLYVRSTLIERIDDTLNHVVEVVTRSLVIESPSNDLSKFGINVEATFQDNNETVEDDHIDLEWFSPTGKLLWSTLSQPLNIPIHPNRMGETVKVNNLRHTPLLLRQVTERVEIGRQVLGYLRVSHPWFEVTKPSHQLMFDLALGTWLMVLSVAASGWFLSGKAMEPVYESYQRLKQFTADASHELRNPLTLIQTNVQVALADLEWREVEDSTGLQYRQQLKVVERLTQRLGKLVNDLLFLARQDSGTSKDNFSTCPIDALLMEVVEEQQLLAAEKEISLSLKLIDPPKSGGDPQLIDNWFTLTADWDQLARLFTNLIANALQYTPAKGWVNVELTRVEAKNRVSGMRHSSTMQIKVADTGIGIPAEAIPRLFDRFYRVDPARTHTSGNTVTGSTTGSGLGLAIAKAIVENHQGQIQVESTLGIGTTITVTLPIILES